MLQCRGHMEWDLRAALGCATGCRSCAHGRMAVWCKIMLDDMFTQSRAEGTPMGPACVEEEPTDSSRSFGSVSSPLL